MPKSRLAWSCWNYLSFTKSIPNPSSKYANGYSTDRDSDDLYSEKPEIPLKLVEREVNEISLYVLLFLFCITSVNRPIERTG